MIDLTASFYDIVMMKLLRRNILSRKDKILVVAAGEFDRDVFLKNGFIDVLITNIAKDRDVQDYTPYNWEFQDIENLTYPDDTFDWAFVHAGLHHCASPHRGLCEMLRVSKKGIGIFEGRDNITIKLATLFGLVPKYELEPCVLSDGKDGGLRNSNIPNFVYRWTEKEVVKTVNSFLPYYLHNFYFYYGLRIPTQRLSMSPSLIKRLIGSIARFILPMFKFLFPKQGNHFAFIISKTGKLQPWLKIIEGEMIFDMGYADDKFNPGNYQKE